jgi:3-isopropylmalate dehydrogenase
MTYRIVFLPGDGVGPEVAAAARRVLDAVGASFDFNFEIQECAFGGNALDATGSPFPPETKKACLGAEAIFLGAVGGPKWDMGDVRPEAGLLELRKALGAYANLRPVRVYAGMERLSPLKEERARGADMLIVRELTGGLYFGEKNEGRKNASDLCAYSREEVERIARVAFEAARGRKNKVTSVDKANVLATSRLWRAAVNHVHEKEFPDVRLEHMLVDAMAMRLIAAPAAYDVILTENLFGDILSDEASVIAGSIGLAPSASIGEGSVGLYEPIHGSAPDIAGKNAVNPTGAILSAAMMLRHSLGEEQAAAAIEAAVEQTLAEAGTRDLGGKETCTSFTALVCERL